MRRRVTDTRGPIEPDLDVRLLALLREDARSNVSHLAATLGVSRATIYNRIAKLEEDGTIAGYTVRLGADHLHRVIRAHVMIKVVAKLTLATQDALAAMPSLTGLYAIAGEHDFIATIEAASPEELNDLIDAIGMLDGVLNTTSSVILATKVAR
jgi:DNA-binding Lrp family transcriptional regulator